MHQHQHSSKHHMMIVFACAVKKKEASMLVSMHSVAAFAAMRVASVARNAPAVAVPRLPNFQKAYAEFTFHRCCCMK